jgi:hypothetical protein
MWRNPSPDVPLHQTRGRRRRLVDRDLDRSTILYIGLRIETVAALFAVSIPVAFFPHGPVIAEWLWLGIFLVRRLLVYRYRRASRSPDATLEGA